MATGKFEYIWKFLRDNGCREVDNITEEMICIICKKILIDPCIACCGCRYCLECITGYLNGEKKHCPRNIDDCTEELLNLDNLGHPDYFISQKISKLIVKCPRGLCEFKGELRKMEKHDKMCKSQPIQCPYSNIGCQEILLVNELNKEHFVGENESHAKLLVKYIGSLQNEIGTMKRDFGVWQVEMSEMRLERAEQRRFADHQAKEIEYLNQEIDVMKNENKSIKEENNFLKLEMEKIRSENLELERQFSDIRGRERARDQEMERLKDKYRQSETRLNELGHQSGNEKEEPQKNIDTVPERRTKFDGLETRVRHLEMTEEIGQWREFIWPISDWAAMSEYTRYPSPSRMYSETFTCSNNKYRMCLSVWPDRFGGGSCLSIWWYLIRGPFDNILAWPFKGVVTLSIINQHTGVVHASETISSEDSPDHHCWQRPMGERNKGFASYEMVNLDSLSLDPALCHDNQIFIKCSVKVIT